MSEQAEVRPCDVIVAQFVFGVERCRMEARQTVNWDGQRWWVCPEHMRGKEGRGR